MNNGYGIQLPAMQTSINLGYNYNPGFHHLLETYPIHNMTSLPGLSSTSPTSSPLTNSLPPIIQQQAAQAQHHTYATHQQVIHQQQQPQQTPHHHHHAGLMMYSTAATASASNQSQQQTPQPSPQHTSNTISTMNTQSLPSSDSIQSPLYESSDHASLLSSGGGNNSNNQAHLLLNGNLNSSGGLGTTTTTTTTSNGSPDDLSSPKMKSKKLKTNNGKSKGVKVASSPLESSLNSLTKEQLVNLCTNFFQASHPDLIQEFENLMPPPDLHDIMMNLDSLQKKYNKLFPSNEFSYDNTSYNRVKSGLASFKKALIEYGEDFKEKNGWATLLQYVILALPYALRMPQWDDEKNNASRVSALNKMDVFGKAAVKGLLQNDLSLEKWERHKNSLSPHSLYLKSTIDELDKCIEKRKKKEEKMDKICKKRKKMEK